MVATYAIGGCNRELKELSKGRLFLLPPTGMLGGEKLSDYCYWLCPDCSSVYTLEQRTCRPAQPEQGPRD